MFNWTYYKENSNFSYPEKYELKTDEENRFYVQFDRKKGLVRLQVHTSKNQRWESVISNGVVISEKDLTTNRSKYLEEELTAFNSYLSSIPDPDILDILHNNYGVNKSGNYHIIHHTPFNIHISDLKSPKDLFQKIQKKLFKGKSFFAFKIMDLLELFVIACYCYGVYLINLNLLHTGLMAIFVGILVGYSDAFLKNKNTYRIKVFVTLAIGIYITSIGIRYQ